MHSTDFHLTSRELAVVHLVARGLSAVEVAKELQIARCTVERHVENVRLKTRTRKGDAAPMAFVELVGLNGQPTA